MYDFEIKVVSTKNPFYAKKCLDIAKEYPKKLKHYESILVANYLVCLIYKDKLVGFVSVLDDKSNSGDMYIMQVAVKKEERGKGYARALLDYVKHHSKGFRRITSDVKINNLNSINLHKKSGYQIVGVCDSLNSFRFAIYVDKIDKNEYIQYSDQQKELV